MLGPSSESARATDSQKLLNYGFQFYDTRIPAHVVSAAHWNTLASRPVNESAP